MKHVTTAKADFDKLVKAEADSLKHLKSAEAHYHDFKKKYDSEKDLKKKETLKKMWDMYYKTYITAKTAYDAAKKAFDGHKGKYDQIRKDGESIAMNYMKTMDEYKHLKNDEEKAKYESDAAAAGQKKADDYFHTAEKHYKEF